jgi:hypothetical protein
MDSQIASAIGLRHQPVALLWADAAPEGAKVFSEGRWGCVMWLVAAAALGKAGACGRTTYGCWGGGVGLGFGDQYRSFPGGHEGFCHFLSYGNARRGEAGRQLGEQVKPFMRGEAFEHFMHGEGYVKDPAGVEGFIRALPITEIPKPYVVFQPLAAIAAEGAPPEAVIFFVDPDQLSALVVLANYGRDGNENAVIPWAAGCQTLGIYAYREAARERPRGVVGLTDLSARLAVRRQLGDHLMTFTAPWRLYQEMEANVAGSFLERHTWQQLMREREA